MIVLGISGSIAAYKAAELVSSLVQDGGDVTVVMTAGATRFVAPLTFQTLTRRHVWTDVFDPAGVVGTEHIEITDRAKLLVIAPATANVLGKLANGIADDMLSTLALAVDCPVLVAPAMNTRMWNHPAVKENVAILKRRGVRFIAPGKGRLACGHVGAGRMAEPAEIRSEIRKILKRKS